MKRISQLNVESYIDLHEPDVVLRCYNWNVDVYIFMGLLAQALYSKWSKVTYLQRGTVC